MPEPNVTGPELMALFPAVMVELTATVAEFST
jgi:hypothetical protein